MRLPNLKISCIALLANFFASSHAFCSEVAGPTVVRVGNTGASGIWILANISYAGMRAQGSTSRWWRLFAFIFGFPGTLVSYLVVDENGERAYGIDLPKGRN